MPKIERFTARIVQPGEASPGAASLVGTALARSGERIRQAGEHVSSVENALKRAARAVKSAELESVINNGLDDAAETYRNRTDFENFETDANAQIEEIRSAYIQEVGDDQILQQSVDLAFQNKSSDFLRAIRAKTSQVVTNRGKGVLAGIVNDELDRYSQAMTPEERKVHRDTVAAKAAAFAESNIISFAEAENIIQDFDDVAESVRADKYIEADADAALEALKSGGFDELSPKIKQAKIEKAEHKIKQNEAEAATEANKVKAAIKIEQEKVTLSALQNIGTLTFDQINVLETNVEDKQMLTNKVMARGEKIAAQEAQKGKALETQRAKLEKEKAKSGLEKVRKDFVLRLDTITAEEVRGSTLPATGKASIESFLKAIKERDEPVDDPVNQHDPVTLSDIDQRINNAPQSIDPKKDMWDKVGDGIDGGVTADQARIRQGRLDKRLEETPRGQSIKQGQDYLDGFRQVKVFEEGNTKEVLDWYTQQTADFNAYLESEQGEKDNAPFEWFKKHLDPEVKSFWAKAADAIWWATGVPSVVDMAAGLYGFVNPQAVTPDELEEINKGVTPERFKVNDPARQKAINILRDAGKVVDEKSIKFVMDNM